ncbi:MAG TPA: M23 family metallopeptidase [Mucilaginibacter sp.]|nr:M23 family metallopeptidase [Mucilaginibacter sp.]
MRKIIVTLFIISGWCSQLSAQNTIQSRPYPQNFFRYPLDLPPSTAGSFGELRGAHFHSGLDFKTNHRTGYPVHAAYDGYVSRLRVQFGGFGHAIYITHPNGFTTVYGHVKSFSPEMEKLIRGEQEKEQSDVVDFKLDPTQIQVCKGDIIAMSGNEGASAGPHLHFEIRDTQTEETINPQLFGLTIPDRIPPTITSIGIYHIDGNPFSENTPRQFLGVAGKNGNYRLTRPQVLNLTGEIGFGIAATDMTSASPNHNGIYSCELKLDGNTVYTFAVERFAFDQTHAVNAYIDYPELMKTRRWMQKCFILPGSRINLYPQSVNRGLINFNDGALHDVEYVVKDVAGNTSTLHLKVKAGIGGNTPSAAKSEGQLFHYDQKNEFTSDKVKVSITPGNLYDDIYFIYKELPRKPGALSATYAIHNKFTPIHDSYDLWIKPDADIANYADKAEIVSTDGAVAGGVYEDGYIKGQPHTFGDFYIRLDTLPPTVTPVNIRDGANLAKARGIFLRIGDNLSGVKSYNGKIDGKWVLMEWDYKTKVLGYRFNDDIAPGKHIFELTVTDYKNNSRYFKAAFNR